MLSYSKRHTTMPRGWIVVLVITIIALLLSGCGTPTPKVYHVGVLSGFRFFADTTDGFKEKMTALGYVEGENIIYDVQETDFDEAAYETALKKFVDDNVDLIFVFPTEASQKAKEVTEGTNIPVLFANANIEDTGLVDSVREPGGNITGVRFPGPYLVAKRFEIMMELLPETKQICVPYMPYPIVASELEALKVATDEAGVTVIEIVAHSPDELKALLEEREKSDDIGCDAILTIPEPLIGAPPGSDILGEFAYKHKIPLGGNLIVVGDYMTVFGLGTDNVAMGQQAALLADKILTGTPAGTTPVVSAESYLQINLKAAEQLGITVSEGLLSQASEIIH